MQELDAGSRGSLLVGCLRQFWGEMFLFRTFAPGLPPELSAQERTNPVFDAVLACDVRTLVKLITA